MTKQLKTLPFGAAHTYIAHIREYPAPLVRRGEGGIYQGCQMEE